MMEFRASITHTGVTSGWIRHCHFTDFVSWFQIHWEFFFVSLLFCGLFGFSVYFSSLVFRCWVRMCCTNRWQNHTKLFVISQCFKAGHKMKVPNFHFWHRITTFEALWQRIFEYNNMSGNYFGIIRPYWQFELLFW